MADRIVMQTCNVLKEQSLRQTARLDEAEGALLLLAMWDLGDMLQPVMSYEAVHSNISSLESPWPFHLTPPRTSLRRIIYVKIAFPS